MHISYNYPISATVTLEAACMQMGITPNTIPDATADSQDGQDSGQDGGLTWLMGGQDAATCGRWQARQWPHAAACSQDTAALPALHQSCIEDD